jgi:hypothetical protein
MALKAVSVDPAQAKADKQFMNWVRTVAKPVQLVCLIQGHVFPDPFAMDPEGLPLIRHQLLPAGEHGRLHNTIQLEAPCQREVPGWSDELKIPKGVLENPYADPAQEGEGERCGTTIRKLLGPGGIIAGGRPIYDYERWYRVPPELLENGWLSKRQRGMIREYIYVELPQLMAAEAKKRAKRRAERHEAAKRMHPSRQPYLA